MGGGVLMALLESIPIPPLPSVGLKVFTFQICYSQESITLCPIYITPDPDLSYL